MAKRMTVNVEESPRPHGIFNSVLLQNDLEKKNNKKGFVAGLQRQNTLKFPITTKCFQYWKVFAVCAAKSLRLLQWWILLVLYKQKSFPIV